MTNMKSKTALIYYCQQQVSHKLKTFKSFSWFLSCHIEKLTSVALPNLVMPIDAALVLLL
jgi:hypothetical protein